WIGHGGGRRIGAARPRGAVHSPSRTAGAHPLCRHAGRGTERVARLQPVADVADEAPARAPRPGGDLPVHRRHLHAVPGRHRGLARGDKMMALVWGAALVGVALKLIVPERFGKLAIPLYLAIGWSGLLVFHTLAATLPATTLWLLVAGGIAYSAGIVFHLWARLHFQNVLWHAFVVIGASLHLL